MLTKEQLTDLFDRLGTPRKGRELILRARMAAPVREVQSRGANVVTMLSSRKMARDIWTESRNIEFAAAVDHEFQSEVLEYYAQPCKLNLELVDDATGEIRDIVHFPDFLVITKDGFTLQEWKSEQRLIRLAERYPYRYQQDSDGRWGSIQIERQLAELGIRYRVCSDTTMPGIRVENYLHLADYFHPAAEPCPESVLERIRSIVQEHGAVYLNELFSQPHQLNADEVYAAIAARQVEVDLDRESLHSPRRFRIYRDAIAREFLAEQSTLPRAAGHESFVLDISPGAVFQYEEQELTISLVSEKEVVFTAQDGATRSLSRDWLQTAFDKGQVKPLKTADVPTLDIARFSETELKTALQRKAVLESAVGGAASDRTLRRWVARQSVARGNGSNEVLALVPKTSARGNRVPRLSDDQVAMLERIYEQEWRSHTAQNYTSCHRKLKVACDIENVKCPSLPTLIRFIKLRQQPQDVRARHGKRMAYQLSEFVDVLSADTPVHGSRPFQYVHIDHTQLDIELISSRTGKPLGRPWLTLVLDAWSRRILAIYLTFAPPSYVSVMMATRDMVRRFGRLPETIVVDNGRDFISANFESFLMAMGVNLRLRPAGQPRHGAVLERMFGRLHTEYIHNLAGNTKATKNVRMTTGKHLPVNFAEWTLEALYAGIDYWAFDFYDNHVHPVLGCSPREAFLRGLREGGARPMRQILFNQDFLIATCPMAERCGVRQVHPQTGVKVNDEFYWSPEFRDPRVAGQRLVVRYDPWDMTSVYVRVKDRWVHARCRRLVGLGQLTEDELKVYSAEFDRKVGGSKSKAADGQRLYEFMQVFTPQGALEAAFERQSENKALYNQLQLSNINPVAPSRKICLPEEISDTSGLALDKRHEPLLPSSKPAETQAEDSLPDFDVF